jgi:hypothetical protein
VYYLHAPYVHVPYPITFCLVYSKFYYFVRCPATANRMLAPGERFILVATSYCLTLQTRQLCDAVPSTLQTLPASTHVPDAVFFFSLDVRRTLLSPLAVKKIQDRKPHTWCVAIGE